MCNMREEADALSGAAVRSTPEEHLFTTLTKDPQAIRLLRQVQGLKERPGSYLGVLQIGCVMFNPAEIGMRLIGVPDPKELDDKHCRNTALLEEPIGWLALGDCSTFHSGPPCGAAARDATQIAGSILKPGVYGLCASTSGRAAASASLRARIACKTARVASSAAAAASSKTAMA